MAPITLPVVILIAITIILFAVGILIVGMVNGGANGRYYNNIQSNIEPNYGSTSPSSSPEIPLSPSSSPLPSPSSTLLPGGSGQPTYLKVAFNRYKINTTIVSLSDIFYMASDPNYSFGQNLEIYLWNGQEFCRMRYSDPNNQTRMLYPFVRPGTQYTWDIYFKDESTNPISIVNELNNKKYHIRDNILMESNSDNSAEFMFSQTICK